MQEGRVGELPGIEKDLEAAIGEDANTQRNIVFDDCKATEDPMLEAVKRLSYVIIAVKDEKVDGTDIPRRAIVEKEKQIDLLKLHKHCGGIGHDQQWPYMIEKFNFLMLVNSSSFLHNLSL